MNFLRGQEQVSQKRALPVNEANLSPTVATSASATVQLYYYSAGVRTSDAGQVAGTVVDATFANKNILNSLGTNVATKNDTSLAYTCLALTTELEIAAIPEIATLIESLDNQTPAVRAEKVGEKLRNGEFVIDYRRGLLIGKKATTASTMTSVTYQYTASPNATFPSGTSSIAIAEDTRETPGEIIVKEGRVRRDTPASSAGTSGDWSTANNDANGNDWVSMGTLLSGENDVNKFLSVSSKFVNASAGKPTSVTYTSFTTQTIGGGVPLTLVGARIVNTTASARYLYLNNASSIGGGATPSVAPVFIAASNTSELTPEKLGKNGEMFATALTIGNSSTAATFTAGSAGDLIVTLYYTTATS